MNQSSRRCSSFYALLLGVAMGSVGSGCGEEAVPLANTTSALEDCTVVPPAHGSDFFGRSNGIKDGLECSVGISTPVTFIETYASADYIHGIRLSWGTQVSRLYGQTNGLAPQSIDAHSNPVVQVKVCVDADNVVTGVRFKLVDASVLSAGHLCGSANQTVFDDIDDVLTNLKTSRGTIGGNEVLMGMKFVYTGPA